MKNEPINIEGEYWDCKQVVKDPQDYPDQTVIDAQNFIRGYEYCLSQQAGESEKSEEVKPSNEKAHQEITNAVFLDDNCSYYPTS